MGGCLISKSPQFPFQLVLFTNNLGLLFWEVSAKSERLKCETFVNCVKILYIYALPSHIKTHSYKAVHVRGSDDSLKTLACNCEGGTTSKS